MIPAKFKICTVYICAYVLAAAYVAPALAQSPLAYPAKGQSAEQTRKDELECQMWAMERTGFNPRQGAPQSYASTPHGSSYGSTVDPTTFGSGKTGQGGAIAGDAGKGAAWGALGGAVFGMKRKRRKRQEADWQRQQQAQLQQQQYQHGRQTYNSAFGLCLESRNYKVQY